MNYNLNDPRQYHEALDFIEHARQNNIIVSIDRKKENRTIQQNKYYWLILRYFGLKYGCPRADAEYYFKQVCNQDIFCRTKTDKQGRTLYILSRPVQVRNDFRNQQLYRLEQNQHAD